ncbi:hypothetical protein Tco_1500478 [Tanacetum coccineum]
MVVLDSCLKHNMVAYLEKSKGNAEFHEIIDFLKRSSIHHALTVSVTPKIVLCSLWKVTLYLLPMLVQPTKDEGVTSERPSEPQPTSFPPHPSKANVEPQSDPSPRPSPTTHMPDSTPEDIVGNQGDWQKEILEEKLESPQEYVSKQGRKSAKAKPLVHKDPLFDELPDDTLDYMDTEDAQDVRTTRDVVNEEKETADDKVSTEDALSTAQQTQQKVSTAQQTQQKVSTDKKKVSTDRPNVSTDRLNVSTDRPNSKKVSLLEQRANCKSRNNSSRTSLRNQMMTYLKHVGNKKHSDLKNKTFKEIQALYEKVKRFDESFTAVDSTEDERRNNEMNEGVKDPDQKSLKNRVFEETPKKRQ